MKGAFAMSTTDMKIRINTELKKEAEELFSDFGMSMASAVTIFMKQAVREQRLPFIISRNIPNADTLAAMRETDDIILNPDKHKSFSSIDEFFKDLLEDDDEISGQ